LKQLSLFEEQIPEEKLPTSLTSDRHPIHRWFNFVAGFSPEFVSQCIRSAKLKKEDILIDPFAGLSTSLVQGNLEGINAIGFEAHPFLFDLSQAKLFPPNKEEIDNIETLLLSLNLFAGNLPEIWSSDALKFLLKLFSESNLRQLASAVLIEEKIQQKQRSIYRLIVSRVVEMMSTSQTDGIYKAPTTKKTTIPYINAVKNVCAEIKNDIDFLGKSINYQAKIYPISSEKMLQVEDESCSLCVTSPPYLNNFDFAEMTPMELYFWRYASSWREIMERVRRQLIVNTTTAPTELKRNQIEFSRSLSPSFCSLVSPIIEQLQEQRKVRAGKKDYYLLVYPYFAQMQSVIRELRRVLKPGSYLHLVVANAALYGIHIRVHLNFVKTQKLNAFRQEARGKRQ
jgi:DNA modification methylase